MWDIIQNFIIWSIVLTIVSFIIRSLFKIIIIAVVIALALYGLNYFDIF